MTNEVTYARDLPKNFAGFATRTATALRTSGNRALAVIWYSCVHQISPHGNTVHLQKIVNATAATRDIATIKAILGKLIEDKGVTINSESHKVSVKKTRNVNAEASEIIFKAMNKGLSFRSVELLESLGIGGKKEEKPFDLTKYAKRHAKIVNDAIDAGFDMKELAEAFGKAVMEDRAKRATTTNNAGLTAPKAA